MMCFHGHASFATEAGKSFKKLYLTYKDVKLIMLPEATRNTYSWTYQATNDQHYAEHV